MPRVLMNFQHYKDWVVHFIEADCQTTIGSRTRYYHFPSEEGFRAFVSRCNLEDMTDFEHSMRAWSRGSNYANLSEEQYEKLLRR
jgi:hypothetical protein